MSRTNAPVTTVGDQLASGPISLEIPLKLWEIVWMRVEGLPFTGGKSLDQL